MNSKLTAINNSLTEALAAINSLSNDLVSSIDTKKNTIIELLIGIKADYSTMKDLSKICGTAGSALLDISESCTNVADVVATNILDIDGIPSGSVGTFVDYCADCGEELHIADQPCIIDGEILCSSCYDSRVAPDEDVVDETEEVVANV